MERDEALRLLKGGPDGIAEWNRRLEAGEDVPDLSDADLSKMHLSGASLNNAKLAGANFRGATLRYAKLSGSYLGRADFSSADLHGADLNGASLIHVKLNRANLTEANCRRADLFGADLTRAELASANLSDASCGLTAFVDLDLSGVIGLDSPEHRSPSSIGVDTLLLSNGKVPESFLRGCGVPESVIVNRFALIGAMEPIQFYSCFISHSTEDEEFAKRLHGRMVEEKLRVWFAPEDIKGGRKILDQLERAIQLEDKLLLVLSQASMQSAWVETELRAAMAREQRENRQILFPIRIAAWDAVQSWKCFDSGTGRDLARVVREYHIPDFSNWKDHDSFGAAFGRLLDDLKAEESTGVKPA
jgi:uncharacterized protein YjbI with pentapeptide repeats